MIWVNIIKAKIKTITLIKWDRLNISQLPDKHIHHQAP